MLTNDNTRTRIKSVIDREIDSPFGEKKRAPITNNPPFNRSIQYE